MFDQDSTVSPPKYFIIGTQKSGTTWLRDCLDLFVPFCKPEWYFPELAENIRKSVNAYGGALPTSEKTLRSRAAVAAAWAEICRPYMGEKSAYPCSSALMPLRPDLHPLAVGLLKEHLPDCRIAVIVRDPRAVYNSLCHYLDGFRPRWSAEIDVEEFATEWSRQNVSWSGDRADVVVRYERLKLDFSETLRQVLGSMRIRHDGGSVERARRLVYSVDQLRPTQPEIYRTGTTDEWRAKVAPEISARIAEIAGPAMIRLGYELD